MGRTAKNVRIEENRTSFYCNDEKLMDSLGNAGYLDGLDLDGCGLAEVPVIFLEELLNENILEESKSEIRADLVLAIDNEKESVIYYIY